MQIKKIILALISFALFVPCGAMQQQNLIPQNEREKKLIEASMQEGINFGFDSAIRLLLEGNWQKMNETSENLATVAIKWAKFGAGETLDKLTSGEFSQKDDPNIYKAYEQIKDKILRVNNLSTDQNYNNTIDSKPNTVSEKNTQNTLEAKPTWSFWDKCKAVFPVVAVFGPFKLEVQQKDLKN